MAGVSGPRCMIAAVLTLGAAAAQPASAQVSNAAGRPLTFTRDVAPIFQEKCEACHRPDNIGPMSLVTYEDVRPWVRSIKSRGRQPRDAALAPRQEASAFSSSSTIGP